MEQGLEFSEPTTEVESQMIERYNKKKKEKKEDIGKGRKDIEKCGRI